MTANLDVIIANNRDGQTVNVPYKDTEPVFYVLERIRSQIGINQEDIKRQDLYINGKRIQDYQKSMDYYRIFGNTLTYRALPDKDITLQVKCLDGQTRPIVCQSSITFQEFKHLYWQRYGVPPHMARFIFQNRELRDGSLLHEFGIQDDCTLHLVVRLRGGGAVYPGMVFSDVSNSSNVRKVQFSMNAPEGRYADVGTNVECECACTPTHQVICIKNLGLLELTESTFECPNCEQFSSDWVDVTERDCYQLFDAGDTTVWRRLVIESADLNCKSECTICLDRLVTFDTLACGHSFHTNCISAWNGSCPNCRFNQHLVTGRAADTA
ncbi:hypothetical protein BGZ97_009446 [Linnemannia gamsii]|uniref:Ubiquitin n=1 Tax=Linnemannia gamsii TaxID=64522 RepID=A0A9P6UPM1_9FUNG|nr:hypothetical protein BGZ97_009446 [Linnemannia gamsii]